MLVHDVEKLDHAFVRLDCCKFNLALEQPLLYPYYIFTAKFSIVYKSIVSPFDDDLELLVYCHLPCLLCSKVIFSTTSNEEAVFFLMNWNHHSVIE